MRLEYVPDTDQPDVRFEFEIEEIFAYFPAHLKALEAAPENYSPHKHIVRDHQDRMQPFIELQARIRHVVEQREGGSLT